MDLNLNKRCTTCRYEKSETKAACVDCEIEINGVQVDPTNWEPLIDEPQNAVHAEIGGLTQTAIE